MNTKRFSTAAKAAAFTAGTALLLTACSGGVSDASEDDVFTASIALPHSEESGENDGVEWYLNEVEERSDGRISFDVYYNGSLIGGPELPDAVADGRVQGGWYANTYWPERVPLHNVASLPFDAMDPYADSRAFYELYQTNDAFKEEIQSTGLHVPIFHGYTRTVFATQEPLDDLDALSSGRFRTIGTVGEVLEDLGSDTVFLDAPDIYESLSRGIIDGVAGYPFSQVVSDGFTEVAPHITDIGYGTYSSAGLGLDLKWYESLPEDLKTIIDDVAREYHEERFEEIWLPVEQATCDSVTEVGGSLSAWSEDQVKDAAETIGSTYYDEYIERAIASGLDESTVQDFYDEYQRLNEEFMSDGNYESDFDRCVAELG